MLYQELLNLIKICTREICEQDNRRIPDDLGPDTRLFGESGLLDSMGLVSLVVAVEENIEDQYDVAVSLANQEAMSLKRSPFRSIGSLAEYANQLLSEQN
jgi:acyl carrier protein